MRFQPLVLAAFLVIGSTWVVFAHGGATGIVKQRMVAMSDMAKAMKSIGTMFKTNAPYDPKVVEEGAALIKQHSGEAMTVLFPANVKQKASEARDEIWNEWVEFEALAAQLGVLADGLSASAKNGKAPDGYKLPASIRDQAGNMDAAAIAALPSDQVFALVGRSCSACHEKFRLEKK